MAAVFLHDGIVCLWSDRDLSRLPMPPGVQHYTEFDENTNTVLIAEFNANYSRFAFAAGALQRDGVPVVFATESNERAARREIKDQINNRLAECDDSIAQADAMIAAVQPVIDGVEASTNAQIRTMVKILAQRQKQYAQELKSVARNQKRILRLLKGLI